MSTVNQSLDDFRLSVPIEDGVGTKCQRCPVSFFMPEFYSWEAEFKYPRQVFPLCRRCYSYLYFRTTVEGQQEINELISRDIPKAYRTAEFNTLECSGGYGVHLSDVRQQVIRWAQDYVAGQKRSLYLFSKPGAYGSGCGNGKTHLLWAAYRYISRNTAHYVDEDADNPYIPCLFLDIEELVRDFKARNAKCDRDETPSYSIPCGTNAFRSGSFDEYRDYLAGRRLLFIDDIGKGFPKGMLLETIEYIIDHRASNGLPTFYTSNYSLGDLDQRLGPRLASRILRNGCDVVEIRAPDYYRCRATEAAVIERLVGEGGGTPVVGERNDPADANNKITKEAISK